MLSQSSIKAKVNAVHTFLWENIPMPEQSELISKVKLHHNENCVIYYRKNFNYSWIISTHRLIILDNIAVLYIS